MGIPKPLLDFDGTPCLEVVLRTCLSSRAGKPIVVLGHEAERIRQRCDLSRVTVVVNKQYARGQTSSLLEGLSTLPSEATGFLLHPVDYPLVKSSDLNRLVDSAGSGKIILPTFEGRRGHPVLFDKSLVPEFKIDEPAHTAVRRDPGRVKEIVIDHPGIIMSMNTPEDYSRCKELFTRKLSG